MGKRPVRVLWMTDSMKTAKDDAQMGAFIEAADSTRLSLDLLVLGPVADHPFRRHLEAHGGSVLQANALTRGDIGAFFRARRRVREGKYDLIHTHASWASVWGTRVGRLLHVPVVATLYDARIDESGKTDLQKEEERAVRTLRRWGARVVALSGAQWDRYVHSGDFARSFLEVIHQGVAVRETPIQSEEREASQIWLRRYAGFPPGGQIATTIADLDDWQSGVDVLLWAIPDIVKASPQTRFVIVGDGKHMGEMDRRIRARGLNKLISWHTPDDDIERILMGSDLFVHPSIRDPFPVAALRGMAVGLPVVGTRVGGVPEIIGTSEAGRLVPRSDSAALARAVVDLVQDPPQLRVMGRAATDRVRKLFPVTGWVERIERLYHEVLEDVRLGHSARPKSYARLDVELLNLSARRRSNGTRTRQTRESAALARV